MNKNPWPQAQLTKSRDTSAKYGDKGVRKGLKTTLAPLILRLNVAPCAGLIVAA